MVVDEIEKEAQEVQMPEDNKDAQVLEACKQEVASWKEQFLRARADFENFSKRMEKERSTIAMFAQNEILLDLLSVVDNFDRALEQEQKDKEATALAGFAMIRTSLIKLLEEFGVMPMTDYTMFDPNMHDAISRLAVEGKTPGTIVHVSEQGYMRNGSVLRPAKVVVAQ